MKRVVFLCSPENPHSLMAEGLLRHIDSKNFEAVSVTASLGQIDALSIEVMKEIGVSLEPKACTTIDGLRDQTFDFLITLDDATANHTHSISAVDTVHWKFESPIGTTGDEEAQRRAFRSLRDQIAQRLRLFAIVHTREIALSGQAHFAAATAAH